MLIRHIFYAAIYFGSFLFAASALDNADWGEAYAIVGATIFDGTGKPSIKDGVIMVLNDKIVAIDKKENIEIPSTFRIVDAKNKFIVPGLIDAHMHFDQSAGLYTRPDAIDLRNERSYADEVAQLKARLPFTMEGYICSGVTSVVDMGGPYWTLTLKDRFSRESRTPRIHAAGPLLSTEIPKELQIDDPSNIPLGDEKTARKNVNKILDRGAALIKIWLIDNNGSTEQSLKAVIDEAHKRGSRVAVHATELALAHSAVKAGADVLVHSVFDELVDEKFLELVKQNNVIYIPTFNVDESCRSVLYKHVKLTPLEKTCGDPQAIATWAKLKSPLNRPIGDDPTIAKENLRRIAKAGITIAAGSDAGNIGSLHGPSLHRELVLMNEAGLSPRHVLLTATRDAARVIDPQPQVGTLEKNKLADFLILDDDPLVDVRNLAKIDTVVKGGKPYKHGSKIKRE